MRQSAQYADAQKQGPLPGPWRDPDQAGDLHKRAEKNDRDQDRAAHGAVDCLKGDRVGFFRDLSGHQHEEREYDGHEQRQKRRCAHIGKAGLDDHQGTYEAYRACDQTPRADLFLQDEPAEKQHDEGHNESDGDGIGQRQEHQRCEHRPDPNDVECGAQPREPEHAARQGKGPPGRPCKRDQDRPLDGKADQKDLPNGDAARQNLGHPVTKRGQDAEAEHEKDAQKGAVASHCLTLRAPLGIGNAANSWGC